MVDVAQLEGVALNLSRMPTGAPPKVPWIEGEILHRADGDVPLGTNATIAADLPSVFAFGTGALLHDQRVGPAGTRVRLLDATGTVTYSAPATLPALSWDQTEIAWWEPRTHELVLGDVSTGRLRRVAAPTSWTQRLRSWGTIVLGWMGEDDLILEAPGRGTGNEIFWRTSGHKVPAWTALRREGMSAEAGIALVADYPYTRPTEVDADCLSAVDLETSARIWRRCYRRGDQPYPTGSPVFSPDGTRIAVLAVSITTGDPGYLLLLDSATGEVLTRFDLGKYQGDDVGLDVQPWTLCFEDEAHLLMAVGALDHTAAGPPAPSGRAAVVRCEIDGGCELATPVVSYSPAPDARPPYRLP